MRWSDGGAAHLPSHRSLLALFAALLFLSLVVSLSPVGAMGYYLYYVLGDGYSAWFFADMAASSSAGLTSLQMSGAVCTVVGASFAAACFIVALCLVARALLLANALRLHHKRVTAANAAAEVAAVTPAAPSPAAPKPLAQQQQLAGWESSIRSLAGGTTFLFVLTLCSSIVGGVGVQILAQQLPSSAFSGLLRGPAVGSMSSACFFAAWAAVVLLITGGCCSCGGGRQQGAGGAASPAVYQQAQYVQQQQPQQLQQQPYPYLPAGVQLVGVPGQAGDGQHQPQFYYVAAAAPTGQSGNGGVAAP